MSTPVDLNIAMPYGVTVEGDGQSRKAVPVTKSSKVDSGNRLRLTSGPCRIAASWSGPEEVRVTIFGVGYPLTIPAGGGIVLRWCQSARNMATQFTWRTLPMLRFRRALAALSKCSRSASSSSDRWGGGVGDHPERQLRRGHGRAAGDPVVRSHHQHIRQCEPDRHGRLLREAAGGRVHHFGQLPASQFVRVSIDEHGCFIPLSHQGTQGGGDGRDFECGGTEGRNTLPADSLRHSLRCGRNHHHLPAGVAAGGGCAK